MIYLMTRLIDLAIAHEQKGFDFQDKDQVAAQIEKVLSAVKKFKNHPAILLWGIGNEMEGYQAGDSPAVWTHIEQLCCNYRLTVQDT